MPAAAKLRCGPEAAALAVEHWRWAAGFARKKARDVHSLDEDEVIGEVVVALVQAAQRFDQKKGVDFRSFALFRIRGAIRDYQRSLDRLGRWERPAAKAGIVTKWARAGGIEMSRVQGDITDLAANDRYYSRLLVSQPEQEEAAQRAEIRAKLVDGMEQLSWRQREVLERVHFRGETLEAAGTALGITESGACRIANHGYRALRRILREDPRDPA